MVSPGCEERVKESLETRKLLLRLTLELMRGGCETLESREPPVAGCTPPRERKGEMEDSPVTISGGALPDCQPQGFRRLAGGERRPREASAKGWWNRRPRYWGARSA